MIDLSRATFIGKGRNKQCYVFPTDSSRCIKVSNEGANPKELKKELREYKRLSKRKAPRHSKLFIPKYYGSEETSLGMGHIYDRLVKDNGDSYSTLREYILAHNPAAKERDEILLEIFEGIYQSGAIISELNSDNILILDIQPWKFALVDGFGEGASIKLTELHPHFARQKFKRKFIPFKAEVLAL